MWWSQLTRSQAPRIRCCPWTIEKILHTRCEEIHSTQRAHVDSLNFRLSLVAKKGTRWGRNILLRSSMKRGLIHVARLRSVCPSCTFMYNIRTFCELCRPDRRHHLRFDQFRLHVKKKKKIRLVTPKITTSFLFPFFFHFMPFLLLLYH